MQTMYLICGAGLLAFASQGAIAQSAPAACYLEVSKLVSDPPEGVGELGAALHQLDEALRPQVEEIRVIREQLNRLDERQQAAARGEGDGETDLAALQLETQRLTIDLDAKREKLKADYAAQRQALVAPVQARVSQRAQAFAAQQGCADLKMARDPDLAGLQAASARDVTMAFVAWYDGN